MSSPIYLDAEEATPEQLQEKTRLFLYVELDLYIARIGINNDWAAYAGPRYFTPKDIADHGKKLLAKEAEKLFPVCVRAGLDYRI